MKPKTAKKGAEVLTHVSGDAYLTLGRAKRAKSVMLRKVGHDKNGKKRRGRLMSISLDGNRTIVKNRDGYSFLVIQVEWAGETLVLCLNLMICWGTLYRKRKSA